jgi:hypothetical protein
MQQGHRTWNFDAVNAMSIFLRRNIAPISDLIGLEVFRLSNKQTVHRKFVE